MMGKEVTRLGTCDRSRSDMKDFFNFQFHQTKQKVEPLGHLQRPWTQDLPVPMDTAFFWMFSCCEAWYKTWLFYLKKKKSSWDDRSNHTETASVTLPSHAP